MTTRILLAPALAVGALVVTLAAGRAAVPQSTIKAWEDSASEDIEVTVLSVTDDRQARPVAGYPDCTQTRHEFTLAAKVEVVHRSASGMQPGRTITLRHSALRTWPCPVPGGSFGDIVKDGDLAEVYLRPAGTPDGAFMAVHLKKLR